MNSDMTFKVDLGPVVHFFSNLPTNTYGMVAGLEWWHYYLAFCWMFSLFVVPPQLKSLGSVSFAPVWMPFFVLAKMVNFVLAAKRGSSVTAMVESVSRSVTNLEAASGKLADNVKTLNESGLKCLEDVRKMVLDQNAQIAKVLLTNTHADNGMVTALKALQTQQAAMTNTLNYLYTCATSTNTKNELDVLRKSLSEQNVALAKVLNKQEQLLAEVAKDKEVDFCKSLATYILSSLKDEPDNKYVVLGVYSSQTPADPLNGIPLNHKVAVRLGALRKGIVTGSDVVNLGQSSNLYVSAVNINGFPILAKKEVVAKVNPTVAVNPTVNASTPTVNASNSTTPVVSNEKKVEQKQSTTMSDKELVAMISKILNEKKV